MVNKGLSNHFQISHTLNMSSVTPSGYRFGATYVGTQQFGPSEAYPILLGDIDPSGNLNANIIHQFHKNIRTKLVAQVPRHLILLHNELALDCLSLVFFSPNRFRVPSLWQHR